jgi:hypothetical protein
MSDMKKARALVREAMQRIGDFKVEVDNITKILDEAQGLMFREVNIPRGARRAAPMTAQKAQLIRDFKKKNPSMINREIGKHFGVDGGRVSEALNYKR